MPYPILTLDGGGSKGFFTLGILTVIEELIAPKMLHEHFQLIYGTSTGAIIGALLATGLSAKEVYTLYQHHLPTIMEPLLPKSKSSALRELAEHYLGPYSFRELKSDFGVIMTRDEEKCATIATSTENHQNEFNDLLLPTPITLAESVIASSSAYPIFQKQQHQGEDGYPITLIDGGFSANNPALFALSDALSRKIPLEQISLLSLGTGDFPYPNYFSQKRHLIPDLLGYTLFAELFESIITTNSEATAQLLSLLYPTVTTLRINPQFSEPTLTFITSDPPLLERLYQTGRRTAHTHMTQLRAHLLRG